MDIVERLRMCRPEERRAIAMDAAHNPEALDELISMVSGGVRIYHAPIPIKILGKETNRLYDPSEYYSLDDQAIGIESLAETKSPRALELLERLATHEMKKVGAVPEILRHWSTYPDNLTIELVFPEAKGRLKNALNTKDCFNPVEFPSAPETLHKKLCENPYYNKIIEAVEKLKSYLADPSKAG